VLFTSTFKHNGDALPKISLSFCYLSDAMYGTVESEVLLSAETYAAHRECVAILIFPVAVAYTLALSEILHFSLF